MGWYRNSATTYCLTSKKCIKVRSPVNKNKAIQPQEPWLLLRCSRLSGSVTSLLEWWNTREIPGFRRISYRSQPWRRTGLPQDLMIAGSCAMKKNMEMMNAPTETSLKFTKDMPWKSWRSQETLCVSFYVVSFWCPFTPSSRPHPHNLPFKTRNERSSWKRRPGAKRNVGQLTCELFFVAMAADGDTTGSKKGKHNWHEAHPKISQK